MRLLKKLLLQIKNFLNIDDEKNSDQNDKGFGVQGIDMFY